MATLSPPEKRSILKRSIRKSAYRANRETIDKQWKLEQQKLETLKMRRQELINTRDTILHGSKPEKAQLYVEKEKESIDKHYELSELKKQKEKQEFEETTQQMKVHYDTLNRTQLAQNEARKNYNQQLLQENKRLAEYRQQIKQQRRQQEIQYDRQLSQEYNQKWKPNAI
eukprot:364076_1